MLTFLSAWNTLPRYLCGSLPESFQFFVQGSPLPGSGLTGKGHFIFLHLPLPDMGLIPVFFFFFFFFLIAISDGDFWALHQPRSSVALALPVVPKAWESGHWWYWRSEKRRQMGHHHASCGCQEAASPVPPFLGPQAAGQ